MHRAIAEGGFKTLASRRFVIIKELPGVPTIYHVSRETTVISHVGQGPPWIEIATLYLGLKTFDAISSEQKKRESQLFDAFKALLKRKAGLEEIIERIRGNLASGILPEDVEVALAGKARG